MFKFRYLPHYIIFLAFLLVVIKKGIRPWVWKNDFHPFWEIIVNSFPNFLEALVGMLLLTGISFQLRRRYPQQLGNWKDAHLILLSTIIAAIYVISQEFKLHNIGGNNVYDPNDVGASIFGLVLMNVLLNRLGFSL